MRAPAATVTGVPHLTAPSALTWPNLIWAPTAGEASSTPARAHPERLPEEPQARLPAHHGPPGRRIGGIDPFGDVGVDPHRQHRVRPRRLAHLVDAAQCSGRATHGEEEILRGGHDLLEVESIGIARPEEADVQLARGVGRCLRVVAPADDGGVPAHRREPGQNVVVGKPGGQIAQSVPVPLGVVDDETSARRQVRGDVLLDRRRSGDDRVRWEAHELAGPRAQTDVQDREGSHKEKPAARSQDGPEPDDEAGGQAEPERDEGGLAARCALRRPNPLQKTAS